MCFKRLDKIYFNIFEHIFKILFNRESTIVNKICVTMFWAFQQLKGMYSNLYHVTCIAPRLHRVCENTWGNYNSVNGFIAALKKILVNAPSREVLCQEMSGLHLSQFPVITWWGTWIRYAVLLCENLDKIKCSLCGLDSTDVGAIKQAQQLLSNKDLLLELLLVHGYK